MKTKYRSFGVDLIDFNASIKLDETRNLAYTNRGTAYARRGDYTTAIEDFAAALRIDAAGQRLTGSAQLAGGQPTTATAHLAAEDNPSGFDLIVATYPDGRGYMWRQLNDRFAE